MIAAAPTIPTRPALRYHGGKWRIAHWIIAHFPAHRVYVEPFGGAMSVLLQKPRSYAEVYSDLDGEIVNYFEVMRGRPDELAHAIAHTPFSRIEYERSYERTADALEQARRTAIRSFMGFGSNALNRQRKSGFRSNSNRSHSTPAHNWMAFPPNVYALAERLQGVVLETQPAIQVMKRYDGPDTLHYEDPPYPLSTRSFRSAATRCYMHEMTDEQHVELAEFNRGARGMVVVSSYRSKLYDDLYAGWHREERAALADGAKARVEILLFNEAARVAIANVSRPLFSETTR